MNCRGSWDFNLRFRLRQFLGRLVFLVADFTSSWQLTFSNSYTLRSSLYMYCTWSWVFVSMVLLSWSELAAGSLAWSELISVATAQTQQLLVTKLTWNHPEMPVPSHLQIDDTVVILMMTLRKVIDWTNYGVFVCIYVVTSCNEKQREARWTLLVENGGLQPSQLPIWIPSPYRNLSLVLDQ